jgi:hypothetical protein
MIPSVNDRLASVVRALTDVILPSLPPEAGLAQEQIQLVIGHIQILQAQLDGAPAYEAEEADDARALGQTLLAAGAGGSETEAALSSLKTALEPKADGRTARVAVHDAIDALVRAASIDGSPDFRATLGKAIIAHQTPRTMKDRKWFEPMGFDAGI